MHAVSPPPAVSAARILIASFVGTAIEFYDFYVYATAAALVMRSGLQTSFRPMGHTVTAVYEKV